MHSSVLLVIERKKHMSTPTKLFEPFKLGPITLPNRLVMAPLTRNRTTRSVVVLSAGDAPSGNASRIAGCAGATWGASPAAAPAAWRK